MIFLGLVAVDFLLSLLLSAEFFQRPPVTTDQVAFERVMRQLSDGPRPHLLILGDSVFAGTALSSRRADWGSIRIVDNMRHLESPDDPTAISQVAFDGMLPVDMLKIIDRLDQIDPKAKSQLPSS